MQLGRRLAAGAVAGITALGAGVGSALADQPVPWQLGMQKPVSDVARYVAWFHNDFLLWIKFSQSLRNLIERNQYAVSDTGVFELMRLPYIQQKESASLLNSVL
jgi:hypothetical protein